MPEQNGSLNDRSKATSSVQPHGGPPAGTFKWSVLACRLIVLVVWGITPLSWSYVIWSILLAPFTTFVPQLPTQTSSRVIHLLLLSYTSVEAAFSIYYKYLVHLAQVKPPSPKYERAFLRQTLSRALEDGMKQEGPKSIKANLEPPVSAGRRPRRPTFSRAAFSQLSFLDKDNLLEKDDPRAVDWRNAFGPWFLGTPWEELKRENVLEWLAWSFYGLHYEEIVQEWEAEGRPAIPTSLPDEEAILAGDENADDVGGKMSFLYQGLYMLEARSGMPLPEGRANAKSIRLHLDPVRSTSRPLAKYLVTGFFNILIERRCRGAGFVRVQDAGLDYLIRIPEDWKAGNGATDPMMFIHGLGMGLAQYASLVSYFEQHPTLKQRPLILLLQPHISMAFFHPEHRKPPNKTSTTRGLRALVAKWGFEQGITVVSHSNGTIVHGWLLKDCPDLVKRSCFIDPVTFSFNFLYKEPRTGIERMMRYFVGTELGIALMLQRYFDWSSNILWFEEIPNAVDKHRTAFYLSENDSILNAERTAAYLRRHGAKFVEEGGNLRFMRGMAHGESLIVGGDGMTDLVDWMTQRAPSIT